MRRIALAATVFLLLGTVRHVHGQAPAGLPPGPDDRFKSDLLLFVAHPDDDTLAGTYLAKILEEGKRVAVVYGTPGDSGGNQNGPERASSLGAIRQIEARRGLASLGITNVWFLSGHDTAGQDPVRSLANWGHGRVLSEAVRLVRLTRPEVILTWMPMQVAGENHGDHQAASVLAIEAFDLAGDPSAFPEQVAVPTEQFEWLLEGLRPWQPKKIYFMSDAMDTRFMDGHGPSYSVTALSKKGEKYWEYAYRQLQSADTATREKMVTGAQPGDALLDPLRLVRGKSYVRSAVTADVFDGITDEPVGVASGSGMEDGSLAGVSIELGGPWHFYHRFWKAHSVAELGGIDLHEVGPLGGGRARADCRHQSRSDAEASHDHDTIAGGLAGAGSARDRDGACARRAAVDVAAGWPGVCAWRDRRRRVRGGRRDAGHRASGHAAGQQSAAAELAVQRQPWLTPLS